MFSVPHSKLVEIISNSQDMAIDFEEIVRNEPDFKHLIIS